MNTLPLAVPRGIAPRAPILSLIVSPVLTLLLLAGAAASGDVDHAKDVQPILDRHCVKCHQQRDERGPKAGLDLTGARGLLAGGDDGAVVVPGDPDGSRLIALVSLPDDDLDRMPPKGDRLSAEELATLSAWVAAGCVVDAETATATDAATGPDGDDAAASEPATPPEVAGDVPEPERIAIWRWIGRDLLPPSEGSLAAAGDSVLIEEVFPGSPLLRVSWPTEQDRVDDAAVSALARLARQITVLDLGRTGITDKSLDTVLRMPVLVRLDLSRTAITADGLRRMREMPELRTLVLHGTAIGDDAVPYLHSMERLEHLHLWDTEVTDAGEQALRLNRPRLNVHRELILPPPEPEADEDDEF